jgi:AbrB family looped-hinge helix DNA binding protein
MTIMLKVAPNGRVCIPADVRERLGLKGGGTSILEETDRGYVLKTHMQRVREVQERFAHLRDQLPTVDEFIRDRRAMWGETED